MPTIAIRRRRSALAALVTALVSAQGCAPRPAPAPPSAAPTSATTPGTTTATTSTTTTAAPRSDAGAVAVAAPRHPTTCEVEIQGHVSAPAKFARSRPAMTFVAIGDCLAPSPKIIGFGGTTRGRFFVEVFAPWGSDLSLCAASESREGGPSTLYGKAAVPIHAEASGEVTVNDLTVVLAQGPPRTFHHHQGPPEAP